MEVKCPVRGREMEIKKVGVLYGAVAAKPRTTNTHGDKTSILLQACKKRFDVTKNIYQQEEKKWQSKR